MDRQARRWTVRRERREAEREAKRAAEREAGKLSTMQANTDATLTPRAEGLHNKAGMGITYGIINGVGNSQSGKCVLVLILNFANFHFFSILIFL